MNKQYLGLNFKQPFSTGQQLVLDFNGYNSRLDQGYADSLDTGRSNTIWSGGELHLGCSHVQSGVPAEQRQHRLQLRRISRQGRRG